MGKDKRGVVLVSYGMIGMSYAYAMLNQQTCGKLILIDYVKEKAEGEAMDLNHGLAFSGSHMKIWSDTYADCKEADIVTICTGVAQRPGGSRVDLLARNTTIFKSIVEPVTDSSFSGIFLIVTNPVNVMTKVTYDLSGFNPKHIIDSGTSLDTARLRYLVGSYFKVDPRSIHGYVMGEYGDSEFVSQSQICIATEPVFDVIAESNGVYREEELEKIEVDMHTAMDKVITTKKATYYDIGITLTRLTKAVFDDKNSVQTVSICLRGKCKQNDVFVGIPAVTNASGVQSVIRCQIADEEQEKFDVSCRELKNKIAEAERDLNR